jgi:hypothetical protein
MLLVLLGWAGSVTAGKMYLFSHILLARPSFVGVCVLCMNGGQIQTLYSYQPAASYCNRQKHILVVCIHYVVCSATFSHLIPKRDLHRVRYIASSCRLRYLLFSLRSSSSRLHILLRLVVPPVISSIKCFIRQLLHKLWPIHLAFMFFCFMYDVHVLVFV